MKPWLGRIAARLGRSEEGLTVVEVIVAGMIMVVGGLGVLGMVDVSTRNTFRAEQSQVVSNVLQREMEAIKALPYEEIALTTLPAGESGDNNPNSRVVGTNFDTNRGVAAAELKPLVSGGSVVAGPEDFEVEDITGSVYRYVVWDECPEVWLCVESQPLKRLVVAVKLDSTAPGGSDRRYQELQGQVVDPDTEPAENAGPTPGGGDTGSLKLWLTDTPCDQAVREEGKTENHNSHNTRGDCADGLKPGVNVPGAPDLLWPEDVSLPPGPEEEVEETPYDYALDVEPQPDADHGLQLLPSGSCESLQMTELARGVASGPDEPDEIAFKKVHRWLTPAIPAGEEVTLTGSGTFSLWTRTVANAISHGRICVWLFVRTYGEGSVTDTLIINSGPPLSLYFEHFEQTWPFSGWLEVPLSLNFEDVDGAQVTLPPGSRLGLAMSVAGDTETGLQFFYDQPSFDSQLELQTTGALPEWP
jgi:hypothetical protein